MGNVHASSLAPPRPGRSELARLCLPEATRDPDQWLAWTNSLCLVFLAIGLFGARRGQVEVRPVPPLEEPVPVITEPVVVPPQEATESKPTTEDTTAEPTPVAVVVPALPNLSFSVPTIGRLVTDTALAAALPPEPAAVYARVLALNNTGDRGDRPQPPYPPLARAEAEQGTVVLRMTADATGKVRTAEVKGSSGYPILDRATVEFVKRHWRLPAAPSANQIFETTFNYRLETN